MGDYSTYTNIILVLIFFAIISLIRQVYILRCDLTKVIEKRNESDWKCTDKIDSKLNDLIIEVQAISK